MKTKLNINPTIWQHLESLEAEEPGFLLELLETFTVVTPVALTKLEDAWKARDFKTLGRTAHSLKSSCQALGGVDTGEKLAALEQMANNANDQVTDAVMRATVDSINELCAEFTARKTAITSRKQSA